MQPKDFGKEMQSCVWHEARTGDCLRWLVLQVVKGSRVGRARERPGSWGQSTGKLSGTSLIKMSPRFVAQNIKGAGPPIHQCADQNWHLDFIASG